MSAAAAALAAGLAAVAVGGPIGGVHGTVRAFSPALVLDLKTADHVRSGNSFSAEVAARNVGRSALQGVTVRLALPAGIAGGGAVVLRPIGPRAERESEWRLCARQPGRYVLVATASYDDPAGGPVSVASRAEVVVAVQGPRAACS